MKLMFVHQNSPGQFKYLSRFLAGNKRNEVVFMTLKGKRAVPNVEMVEYELARTATEKVHRYLRMAESAMLYGQAVAREALKLRGRGFIPDLIYAHPGWGEALFLKDVFPTSPMLHFTEFYYRAFGSDVDFDPRHQPTIDDVCRVRAKNTHGLLNLESADWNLSPTHWQKSQYPEVFKPRISVVHDGIDVENVKPNPEAVVKLSNGQELRPGDPVVTYVARNLEPYRGFPTFIRSVERICKARPDVQVIVIGGDEISYGAKHESGKPWREVMLEQVSIDRSRVHFLGRVPYPQFLTVLQVSAAHVYLTYPFVLSWSSMEAMAVECLMIASDTPPVREVITHGRNGLLVDFFDHEAIATQVLEVLEHPDRYREMRTQARADMVANYALKRCLQRQVEIMDAVANRRRPPTFDDAPVTGVRPTPAMAKAG